MGIVRACDIMAITVIHQTIILFLLILVGVVCAKTGLLDTEKSKTLSTILIYVVSPAVIINGFQQELTSAHLFGLLMSLLLSIAGYLVAVLLSKALVRPTESYDYAVARFLIIFPNCAYMGIPLISGLFGTEGVFYLSAHFAMFNLVAFTHGVLLMTQGKEKIRLHHIVSPPLISVAVGLVLFLLRVRLPELLSQPVGLLAGMNSPLAMLIAGVSISKTNFAGLRKNLLRILGITSVKLLAVPLALCAICAFLPIDPIVRLTAIVAMACPSAALSIIFAVKYEHDDVFASEVFTVTTLLSVATLPLVILVAGAMGITV